MTLSLMSIANRKLWYINSNPGLGGNSLTKLRCIILFVFQATIGIDFLSKTMYLEDRTVSEVKFKMFIHLNWETLDDGWLMWACVVD